MNTIPLSSKKNKDRTFLTIVFFWSLVVFLYKVPEALDLSRYYDFVTSFQGSALQMLVYLSGTNFDFIYLTSLKIIYDIGIPLSIGTSVYVSLYFITGLLVIKNIMGKEGVIKVSSFLVVCICLAVPFSWVLCVSRTTAALCFLYLGLYKYIQKKYVKASIFTLLAALTHISMILFILVIAVGLIISPILKKVSKGKMILIFIVIGISFVWVGNLFSSIIDLMSETSIAETRYNIYLDEDNFNGIFLLSTNIGMGVKAHIAVMLFFYPLLLLTDKKWDIFNTVLLLGEIMIIIFNFTSPHMVLRLSLFLMPFFGLLLCRCYAKNTQYRNLYNIFISLSFFCEIWEFYNARLSFI